MYQMVGIWRNMDAAMSGVTNAVSLFQTMSAKEKVKFEDMAKGDKVRYDKDMKGYVPPKGSKAAGKRKKDPNAPKRPP